MKVGINEALKLLNDGTPVGIPTETVYGLAARIDQERALKQIFSIKARPLFDPLIVHISRIEMVKDLHKHISPVQEILMQKFWPGPLTIVSEKCDNVSALITSGLNTVAVRMPNHHTALNLINKLKCPVAAPSANMFSHTSPTKAQHVEDEFGDNVPVIDGGECLVGIESTVLQITDRPGITEISILRPGAILAKDIQQVLEDQGITNFEINAKKSVHSPGHMRNHYQPKKPFIILKNDEAWENIPFQREKGIQLFLPRDASLAARVLYQNLRELSETNCEFIYLYGQDLPKDGFWESIWERLEKAASENFSS